MGNADGLSRREYDTSPEDIHSDNQNNFDSHVDAELDKKIFLDDSPLTVNVAPLEFQGHRTRLKGQRTKQEFNPVIVLPKVMWSKDNIKKCQEKDKNAGSMMTYLKHGTLPEAKSKARELVLSSDYYFIDEDILYHLLDAKLKDPKKAC